MTFVEYTLVYKNKFGETINRIAFCKNKDEARKAFDESQFSQGAELIDILEGKPIKICYPTE